MWFRHRAWIPIAWVLSLINFGGAWFTAREGQPWHATLHALLAILFALGAQRLHARQLGKKPAADADVVERLSELEARLADLDKLHEVEGRLTELEERLDFTERALVDVRTRAQLPPKE